MYFASSAGQSGYFFTTPSGKFLCAITGDLPTNSAAGCHGRIPANATSGPRPNTIMSSDGEIGTVFHRGDPQFQRLDGGTAPALGYGTPLYAMGYTCTVDYSAGTTCRNFRTGHGFTVNDVRAELF
ncbi:hypothetical protein G4X40_14200 [Rhodococcus sp. D2-41]|nr:hypothetical protein [Rhodococcus sp. D2-41]